MNKAEYQLKYLLVAFLISLFSIAGCAHRQAAKKSDASPDASFHNPDSNPSALDQPNSKQGAVGHVSLENDLDVFSDEETEEEAVQVADPLQLWNRAMFHVNDKLYFWLLKPVSRGYKAVIPTPVRRGVRNFFHNITAPIRMVSALLQAKGRKASAELSDGFYIVWPVLGPSTLRDSVGMVGDWFLDPVSYVEPFEAYLGVWTLENVNDTSFRIGDYESLKEAAIDPYIALRNIYIQNRKKKIGE
ncbi:MAG: VacJ family lipoprotein [Deltaproteobacteria bacterium]|nr:VacJ family lipoprotein [Deltaproteobacteria bacterium]